MTVMRRSPASAESAMTTMQSKWWNPSGTVRTVETPVQQEETARPDASVVRRWAAPAVPRTSDEALRAVSGAGLPLRPAAGRQRGNRRGADQRQAGRFQ